MIDPAERPSPRETPLEEGLRRYAPKDDERRVRVSDFIVSLLLASPHFGPRR
ncbi:MAG TPA: hypothetical protein VFK86_16120 [Bauldia sp.]|nr:hypothetical protein [Bauldia sp.]